MKQNLLVCDWDFFFQEKSQDPKQWMLYDWGHNENNSLFMEALWVIRAADFDYNNIPRPRMSNEWTDFWERFDIDDDAVLYYGDSNRLALRPEVRESAGILTDQVWLYDAHHDSGYKGTIEDLTDEEGNSHFTCENWMVGYQMLGAELHVRYPNWKTWAFEDEPDTLVPVDRCFDNELPNDVHFDTIFVCRSGAWTPPWCDHDFEDFITDAPVNELVGLEDCSPRDWDEDAVKAMVASYEQLKRIGQE